MKASHIAIYLLERTERNALLRWLLAVGASAYASKVLKRRVRIFYESVWLRQDDQTVVALGLNLRLRRDVNWRPEEGVIIGSATTRSYCLCYQPKPGDTVVDVGAGMADDTLAFSRMVGPSGRVFSFEAHPDTFRCLQKAIEHSRASNVLAVHGAVFSEKATVQIDAFSEAWKTSRVVRASEAVGSKYVAVPAFRLDDFEPLQKLDRIQFLKMNIEGAEVEALLGMPKMLPKVEHACIACHDFLGEISPSMRTRARCKEILLDVGFDVLEIGAEGPPWQRDYLNCIRR